MMKPMTRSRRSHLATATVAAMVTLVAIPGCANGSTGSTGPAGPATTGESRPPSSASAGRSQSAEPSTAAPSPTRSYALSTAPHTIPAVREHVPASGPGWQPGPKARIVVPPADSAELTDEGKLLAGELGMQFAESATSRRGDVELALGAKGSGKPESYTLTVQDGKVRISGPDEAGVFYGTRTLKQAVSGGGSAPEGTVRDAPAKPQRGLNLDIARKNFTPDWIKGRLREMADLKLNQLGLHFSDDQAFRIQSDTHPEIVSDPHLTKAQVREITALAARLHIAVIPEIDSPGHLGAVLRAYPALQLHDVQGRAVKGAVDIANPAAAKLVDELLREYLPLFPGAIWNLGADEYQALVYRDPQTSFPQLAAAARARYGAAGKVQDLATGWLNDRADVVRSADRRPAAWNDGFFTGEWSSRPRTSRWSTGRARKAAPGRRWSTCARAAKS